VREYYNYFKRMEGVYENTKEAVEKVEVMEPFATRIQKTGCN